MFSARYISPIHLNNGQFFYVYNARRTNVGIFACGTKGLTLECVKQRYSPSLAFVAQDCEDITLEQLDFSPKAGSEVQLASAADFVQICMCRGTVRVHGCNFDGAGDDTINVHGIHFRIIKREGNSITVKFCHPQSYGFLPLHPGDTVAFIDSATLLEKGRAVIESAVLEDECTIT